MTVNLERTLQDLESVQDDCTLGVVLTNTCERYGLKSLAYMATGPLTPRRQGGEPFIAVTYSAEWVERYRTREYVKIDPVVQTGLRRLLPFDWGELHTLGPEVAALFDEAAQFGLGRNGISFPVHGLFGDRALLSATSDLRGMDWQSARLKILGEFPIVATHLHHAVLRSHGIDQRLPHLAPREIECLQWISEGKTFWEVGKILGLSEHTVRTYLESARHKLRATSTAHAVSIALKRGLLLKLA